MKTTTKKTTRIKEKVVEYFSLRDNWVEIKRENVMVGQEYNFNQLTSEEVHLQRSMMIMMLLVVIIIRMMIIIIMITYYIYDDGADNDEHKDDVDMVERHLMETCNRVCTNSVQRYKPAKQISIQTLFAFAFARILGLYWLNLYCTKQSTNQETSGELSWAPLRLRLDYALCKEHVFKGARKKTFLLTGSFEGNLKRRA